MMVRCESKTIGKRRRMIMISKMILSSLLGFLTVPTVPTVLFGINRKKKKN